MAKQELRNRERASRETQKKAEQAQAKYESCRDQTTELLDEAKALGSRLDVGLSFTNYSEQVAELKVAYDDVDFDGDAAALECLTAVGLPLEQALNKHFSAYRTWNRCMEDLDCSVDSIDPKLQSAWTSATSAVGRAESGLEDLEAEAEDAQAQASKAKTGVAQAAAAARRAEKAAQ